MTKRKIEYWVIPPGQDAEFVACMEEVLDTYAAAYAPQHPVLCYLHVNLLTLAILLLSSLAIIRLVFYVLRHTFGNSSWIAPFERSFSLLVWTIVALHIMGVLSDLTNLLFKAALFSRRRSFQGGALQAVALIGSRLFKQRRSSPQPGQSSPSSPSSAGSYTPGGRGAEAPRAVEKAVIIWLALDDLAPEFRMTVLLADVEGCAYKEIAAIMGCPIGTVMSRLSRARHLLRTTLQAVLEE